MTTLTPEQRQRLADAGKVETFGDDADFLVDVMRWGYVESKLNGFPEKFYLHDESVSDYHTPERLQRLLELRSEARRWGANFAPDTQLAHYDAGLIERLTDRQWPAYQLGSYIKVVEKIWRQHGGDGSGSYYSVNNERHDGPLLNLVLEIFDQAELPKHLQPSRSTLHQVIQSIKRRPSNRQRD